MTALRYTLFGRSGLRVSELCLGTMMFGSRASEEESRGIFDAFVEAGGNFVDTADAYARGESERITGGLLGARRDEFVLATKYTITRDGRDPNAAGNHRKSLVRALDGSLERLGTDYVDVLWVHIWDELTPIEETMRALDDQVRAGKVLHLGISDTPAWVVARANTIAERSGWTPFSAIQVEYSLIERTVERELTPMARALDLAITAWSPLGQGVLTGRYAADGADGRLAGPEDSRFLSERNLDIARAVGEVAEQVGATGARVALAWLSRQPGVVIPIVGASREEQLRDSLGAPDVRLDEEQMTRLDALSSIELGFPHDFSARVLPSVLGESSDLIG